MHAVTNTTPKAVGPVVSWNKGKLLGQKLSLKLKEIWAIRIRLQLDHRARELALFNLAIDSKLRGCDLVGLHVLDVFQGSHVAPRAIVMQKKPQRPVQFEIQPVALLKSSRSTKLPAMAQISAIGATIPERTGPIAGAR